MSLNRATEKDLVRKTCLPLVKPLTLMSIIPLPLRKIVIMLNLHFLMEILLNSLGGKEKCIFISNGLMMNPEMLLKMDLAWRLKKEW